MGVLFVARDLASDLKDAPNTFSSWNSCMSKAYCKWPVIAAIIVASVICISLLWCLARCLCCGMACCCSCLSCLDCFTPRSRRKRDRSTRYKDDYPTQYGGGPAPMAYQPQNPTQFATFDVSKNNKIHADSLPAMPSWDTAQTRRIEDLSAAKTAQTEGVEMNELDSRPIRPLRGNGYSQIPNGLRSPNPNDNYRHASPEYFHTDTSYAGNNADVGTQRLMHNQEDEFHDSPLSPAPTYHTNPLLPQNRQQSFASDRFAANATSPSPREYNSRDQHHIVSPIANQPNYRDQQYRSPTGTHPGHRDQYNQFPSANQQAYNNNRNGPTRYNPSVSTRYEASSQYSQSNTSPIEIPYHYNSISPIENRAPSAPQQQSLQFTGSSEWAASGGRYQDHQSHQQQQYGQVYDDPESNRPPSLLQVGRRPVKGTVREI